jgi:hypothetical protein
VAAVLALSDRADAGSDTLDGDPSGAVALSDIPTAGPDTRGVQVLAVLAPAETLSDRVRHPEREVPVHATLDIDMTCCVPAGLSLIGAVGVPAHPQARWAWSIAGRLVGDEGRPAVKVRKAEGVKQRARQVAEGEASRVRQRAVGVEAVGAGGGFTNESRRSHADLIDFTVVQQRFHTSHV